MIMRRIITETIVLDTLSKLNNTEKTALKYLHRKYSDKGSLDINEMIDSLEDLGFNFTNSMKLSTFYQKNREYLFKDVEEEFDSTRESEILYRAIQKFVNKVSPSVIEDYAKGRIKVSELTKKYGRESFSVSVWQGFTSFSFYLSYYTENQFKAKWNIIIDYKYDKMLTNKGKITSIPFDMSVYKIDGDFPIPELLGSKDTVEIPVNFDINEMTKEDIYFLLFDIENSLFSDFEDRIMEIMEVNN